MNWVGQKQGQITDHEDAAPETCAAVLMVDGPACIDAVAGVYRLDGSWYWTDWSEPSRAGSIRAAKEAAEVFVGEILSRIESVDDDDEVAMYSAAA
jgi:hypothetical protein